MKKNHKYLLQEKLSFYLDWEADWQNWFKNQEIIEKAKKKFYEDKKFFCVILNFYFLPINLLKYYQKKRAQHSYKKVLSMIAVLKEELDIINNNQKWR